VYIEKQTHNNASKINRLKKRELSSDRLHLVAVVLEMTFCFGAKGFLNYYIPIVKNDCIHIPSSQFQRVHADMKFTF
jgi:hypothetical protein